MEGLGSIRQLREIEGMCDMEATVTETRDIQVAFTAKEGRHSATCYNRARVWYERREGRQRGREKGGREGEKGEQEGGGCEKCHLQTQMHHNHITLTLHQLSTPCSNSLPW